MRAARTTTWPGWLLIFGVMVLVVFMDGGLVAWSVLGCGHGPAADDDYNQLVRGFEKGHLSLDKEAPADLARLPDPYDSDANEGFRHEDPWQLRDQSYYRGKVYLYFGATPALLLFWPWHALTGGFLYHQQAAAAFSIAGFLAASALLLEIRRRHFPGSGAGAAAGCILLLGTITTVPLMVARPGVWEVPISCAYLLLTVALGAVWAAWHGARPGGRAAWAAVAGASCGLAVGARPSLLFTAFVVTAGAAGAAGMLQPLPDAAPAAAPRRRWGRAVRPSPAVSAPPRRRWLTAVLAAAIPLAAAGLLIAAYNEGRFGDPLQFGQHYQLSGDSVHARTVFSPAYLLENLRLYFTALPCWGPHFPFIWAPFIPAARGHGDTESILAVLPNMPILLFAAALPLAWRGRPEAERRRLAGFGAVLAAFFITGAGMICLFYGACNRYEVDFLPPLVLMACLGLLGVERTLASARPPARAAARVGIAALGIYSAAASTLAAAARCNVNRLQWAGNTLMEGQRKQEAVRAFRESVAWSNHNDGFPELGRALCETNQVEEGCRVLREAVRRDSQNLKIRSDLGIALCQAGHYEEGLEAFREAERLLPSDFLAYKNCGTALLRMNRLEEAAVQFKAAAVCNPNNPEVGSVVGTALVTCGHAAEGIGILEHVVQLRPAWPTGLTSLGAAYARVGRIREAVAELQKAEEIDPSSQQTRDNVAKLNAALASNPGAGPSPGR